MGSAWAETQDAADRVDALFARETEILNGLDALDRRIVTIAGNQEKARVRHAESTEKIKTTQREIKTVSARVDDMKGRLKKRLQARADLRLDEAIWRRLVFTSESPNAWVRRREYVRSILRYDLTLLKNLRDDQRALENLQVSHLAAVHDVQELERALVRQRNELETDRTVRARVLKELKQRRRTLRTLLRRRAEVRRGVPLPPSSDAAEILTAQGRLTWPTIGRILVPYGPYLDEQLGTETQSNGWIMNAPHGAPVRAVFPGRVVFAGWYTGYGNLVIVDHGAQHHSLYAHLSSLSIAQGKPVEQGQILGMVGDTSSLRGPQLYFEFRIKRKPVDPAQWLREKR